MVMLFLACAWRRNMEAIYAALRRIVNHDTVVATAGGEKPTKVSTDNIHKRWCGCDSDTDKGECELL